MLFSVALAAYSFLRFYHPETYDFTSAFQDHIIEIASVQHFLNESEVDKDEEGILLKEMKSCQDKLMEALKELQIKNNENLKKIAEEHSYLSKMYKEIKRRRALVEDVKIEEQMKENCVVEIDGVQIMEDNFVRIFAPGGHLHDDVVGVLRFIWMKSWDDQIVLSMGAVVSAI